MSVKTDEAISLTCVELLERRDEIISGLLNQIDSLNKIAAAVTSFLENEHDYRLIEPMKEALQQHEVSGCEHDWVCADNEVVKGCEICVKCEELRAKQ